MSTFSELQDARLHLINVITTFPETRQEMDKYAEELQLSATTVSVLSIMLFNELEKK